MAGLHESRIRENVLVWTLGGETMRTSYGANAGAVIGRREVLLIDPFIAPAHARLLESALRRVTALPVRRVVLTHHHTDHALGAGYFAAAGAQVVAHQACAARMSAEHAALVSSRRRQTEIADLFADAEPYRPSMIFEEETALDLGGTTARVIHPGHNHTPGDAVVALADQSVVFCGDLVSHGYHVNYEDAAVENLGRGLDLLRSLKARSFVPGHGASGGAEVLEAQARYHSMVRDAVLVDSAGAPERIRSAFPSHLLKEVLCSLLDKPWPRD